MRAAARLILLLPRNNSVENEIRTVLHWLDVLARVTFKLFARSSVFPWISSALPGPVLHTGQLYRRTLTSPFSRHGTLFVPRSQTSTIGPGAFVISSPSAWNSLLVDLRYPGLSFWLSVVDSRLICSILALLSCPFYSYFCIVLVWELLAAFVTI